MGLEKVIIIGAGIAGPCIAIALQKIGVEASIYEAHEKTAHGVGSFLGLEVNGLDALRTLGVQEAVRAVSVPTPKMVVWSGSGKQLGEFGNSRLPDGTASVTIKRTDLYNVLTQEALRHGIHIEYGKRLVNLEYRGEKVIAMFSDGSAVAGGALVGADGVHSMVRKSVSPDAPTTRYTGLVGTGGITNGIHIEPTPNTFNFVFGKRAFFGYTSPESGVAWWFVNIPWPKEPSQQELGAVSNSEWKQQLLNLFRDDKTPAYKIIESADEEMGRSTMHTMDSPATWYRGRSVLIGDAAHVTSPSSGQGASLAIEDALILAKCIRDRVDLSEAFGIYQQLRHNRIQRVIKATRWANQTKAAGPVSRTFRDAVLPVASRWIGKFSRSEWLLNYHIDFEHPIEQDLMNN